MDNRRRMMLATMGGGGTPLSDLPEGSILKILEGGVLTDFYVAKHNYESSLNGAGRTLLLRKDCYDKRQWHSSKVNRWASCTLRSWLNGDYLNLLDEGVRRVIGTTKYYYTIGYTDKTVTTRSDAVFLLSYTELGGNTSPYANAEGTALPIASAVVRLYGSIKTQWTRSPKTTSGNYAWCWTTDSGGIFGLGNYNATYGSRPVFTLPAEAPCELNADGSFTLSI